MAESQPQLQLQPPISLPTPNAAASTSVKRGTFFGMKPDLSKFQKNGLPALMEARQSDVPAWKASADVVSISNSKIEQSDAEKIHKRMTMNCESPGVPMEEFSKLKTLNDLKIAAYAKKKDTIDEEEDEFEFDDDLEDAFDDEGEEAVTFAPANSAKTRGKTIKMNADEFLKFNNSKIEKEQDAERKSIVQRRSVAAEKITNSASAIDAISGAVNEDSMPVIVGDTTGRLKYGIEPTHSESQASASNSGARSRVRTQLMTNRLENPKRGVGKDIGVSFNSVKGGNGKKRTTARIKA